MKKQLRLLLVDFDGVLSNGRFYHVPDDIRGQVGSRAAQIIFSRENKSMVHQWMRGELTYQDVHERVARETGTDVHLLDNLLKESIAYMPLNPSLLHHLALLRSKGVIVSLFTNNMDIFDDVSREHHQLDTHFDHIYSSSAYGQLKLENEVLVRKALQEANVDSESTALVDDSPDSFARASSYGITTFLYDQYEDSQVAFEQWLEREYHW